MSCDFNSHIQQISIYCNYTQGDILIYKNGNIPIYSIFSFPKLMELVSWRHTTQGLCLIPLNDFICHQGGSMGIISNSDCGLVIGWWNDESIHLPTLIIQDLSLDPTVQQVII